MAVLLAIAYPAIADEGVSISLGSGSVKIASAAKRHVSRIIVSGSYAFRSKVLHDLVKEAEGRDLTFSELQEYADRITQYHHRHGHRYTYAILPRQSLESGTLRITVVNARHGEKDLKRFSQLSEADWGPATSAPAPAFIRDDKWLNASELFGGSKPVPPAHPPQPVQPPPRFDIVRYEVEGNTLLGGADVAQLLASHTGHDKDFGDIQRAVEALEKRYHDRGYGATKVSLPEQKLKDGVVRIKVIEGHIGSVTVQGNHFHDTDNIRRSLPSLKEGATPNMRLLGREMHLANENPAKQTQVVLKSGEQEGEVDATVSVTDDNPGRAFLSIDNSGTTQTGKTRLGVGYQHANLFDRDQVFTVQYTTSPEKLSEMSIYGAGYHIPLYELGASLDFFGGYSDVNSGVVSNLFTVSGKGTVLGARYNQALQPYDTYSHKLIYGLDYRAYQNSVIPVTGGSSMVPDYTVHPLSLSYAGQWVMPSVLADFYVTLAKDFSGGDKASSADLNAARTGADANYSILHYGANFARQWANDWQLRLAFSGQYTTDPLVPGEQFGLGGAASVRGFEEREIANDTGYRGSIEAYTPDLARHVHLDGNNLRALFFYDFGGVRRNQPLPSETASLTIASIGAGLRLVHGKQWNAALDFAHVTDPGGNQRRGDDMIHFNLGMVF